MACFDFKKRIGSNRSTMQSTPAHPSLSDIPCFSSSSSSSRAKQSTHHQSNSFAHHDRIFSSDKHSHNLPHHGFDGGVHVSHRCIGCPVYSISLLHNTKSLSSSPEKSLTRSVLVNPFSSSSSFSSLLHNTNPLSSSPENSLTCSVVKNPFSPSSSPAAAGRSSLKWSVLSSAFAPTSSSSLVSSLSSSSPSASWMALKGPLSNNPVSCSSPSPLPFRCTYRVKCGCAAKGPLSSSSFPSSSSSTLSSSPYHNMGSPMRQAGKCNCNLLSLAKDFITEQLGLTDEEKEELLQKEEEVLELSQGSPQSAVKFPKQKEGSQASMGGLAQRWREIQGLNHWEGLLDPLDLELRRMLLFYGDFNQAVYDSFETDVHSKYTGACRFAKEDFFEGVRLVQGREVQYDVVRYLYATSTTIDVHGLVFMKSYSREAWSKESNWIGYIAVSNDEATKVLGRRDIVIVWRGTMRPFEWLDDFQFMKADVTPLLPPSSQQTKNNGGDEPSIEQGWLTIYTSADPKSAFTSCSARDQVLHEVKMQLNKYKDEDVSITIMGHSLGAALAVVNAFDVAVNKINVREGKETTLVTAFVFGCPSVGDEAFLKKCEELEGLRVLRVRNKIDLITRYPGWLMGYRDVGDELLFDSQDSPYLKRSKAPGDWHNLEVHLHMVAGTQGVGNPFKLTVNRDVALINKSSEALRDDFLIPPSWWQMQYKGLVQREDGFWYMPDREEGKRPKPEPLNDDSMVSRS